MKAVLSNTLAYGLLFGVYEGLQDSPQQEGGALLGGGFSMNQAAMASAVPESLIRGV